MHVNLKFLFVSIYLILIEFFSFDIFADGKLHPINQCNNRNNPTSVRVANMYRTSGHTQGYGGVCVLQLLQREIEAHQPEISWHLYETDQIQFLGVHY